MNRCSYLFLGDTHGDLDFVERAAELAAEYDAEIIQVGDWGFLWPGRGVDTLSTLSDVLKMAGEKHAKPPVRMYFVDGNHDWHPRLRELVGESSLSKCLGVELAPNVIYQPRGSTHQDLDGTRFLFLGGACSIDRQLRKEGLSWWPEERVTEGDYLRAKAVEGPVHVLVTHDAPDYPPTFEPRGSKTFRQMSAEGMEYLRRLGFDHDVELHVHGHWHFRYTRSYGKTKVVGLDCNYGKFNDAVMLWSR